MSEFKGLSETCAVVKSGRYTMKIRIIFDDDGDENNVDNRQLHNFVSMCLYLETVIM